MSELRRFFIIKTSEDFSMRQYDKDGDYYDADDVDTELTRLRGELERAVEVNDVLTSQLNYATIRAETAEAKLVELQAKFDRSKKANDELKKSWQNAVDDAMSELKYRQKVQLELAELRARVRPGVKEIMGVFLMSQDEAQAIHDILPPVPKVLTVEDCKALATELQAISEQISSTAPDRFKNREEAEAWYEKTKGLEVEAHAKAIHKAMGGEE